jgi:bifunctional enzyme CysN/CysC
MAAGSAQHSLPNLLDGGQTETLRFCTCGSVDDGKSTLIGRLLHESKNIFDDQWRALEVDSRRYGTQGERIDYALLVDGLQAEREQGITIDVAYRFFATAKRRFIVADTPGHEQYTRNMATGASTADFAIVLVDARKGILTQTRRHSRIVSMMGVRNVVVAVNKMDLVDYSEPVIRQIERDYRHFASTLNLPNVMLIPLSALEGDNVVEKSRRMSWYAGPALLQHLESVELDDSHNAQGLFCMPVQWVTPPGFPGFCGARGRRRPEDR